MIAPELLIIEINRHFDKILKFTKDPPENTLAFLNECFNQISFMKLDDIPFDVYQRAYNLCKDYDENDTSFVALALYKDALLWTGDKIKNNLINNGFDNFFIF